MKIENQKWHSDVLKQHNRTFHSDLIHPRHVTAKKVKSYTFEQSDGQELPPMRGFFAEKEQDEEVLRYFLPEDKYKQLPIRINKSAEILFKEGARTKSIVLLPEQINAFRINAERKWDKDHTFLAEFLPFQHSHPLHWELLKILSIMGYVGKIFVCISGPSECGKSSTFRTIHGITHKSIVYRPRSPAGLLLQINEDGNVVFDEAQLTTPDTLKVMEEFAQLVADRSPEYTNGALKAPGLKQSYDTTKQSITFLYNLKSYYKDPDKQFFEHIWGNPQALATKFLKMKLDGALTEQFDTNFNVIETARENKQYYVNVAKHLLFLKQLKERNEYVLRFPKTGLISLQGRHKQIYDEILWGIDLFSETQERHDALVITLNTAIQEYQRMIGEYVPPTLVPIKVAQDNSGLGIGPDPELQAKATAIIEKFNEKSDREKILTELSKDGELSIEDLETRTGIKDIDKILQTMLSAGDIVQNRPGYVGRLS